MIWSIVMLACAMTLSLSGTARAVDDGIVRIKSAYSMPETIKRLKMDVADKGIMFFDEIDQSKLAADAGVTLRPSTLVFGNPPLGRLLQTSNPMRARLASATSLYQDATGDVRVAYTDFVGALDRGTGLSAAAALSAMPSVRGTPRCFCAAPTDHWQAMPQPSRHETGCGPECGS